MAIGEWNPRKKTRVITLQQAYHLLEDCGHVDLLEGSRVESNLHPITFEDRNIFCQLTFAWQEEDMELFFYEGENAKPTICGNILNLRAGFGDKAEPLDLYLLWPQNNSEHLRD